jgi:hypothetical protein
MNEIEEQFYRGLVESAGAIYVGVQKGYDLVPDSILFQRIKGGNTIAVYAKALRTVHDVELALKADAEKFVSKVFA